MKKTIAIPVTAIETREIRYIKAAEDAIQALRRLVSEMDMEGRGRTLISNEKTLLTEEKTALFQVRKTIDTDLIKEPLENVEKLVKQLHEEISKLEMAIVTELTKEKPQE